MTDWWQEWYNFMDEAPEFGNTQWVKGAGYAIFDGRNWLEFGQNDRLEVNETLRTIDIKFNEVSAEALKIYTGGGEVYETLDSGERQEYASGMRRDLQDGKARFDLLFAEGVPYEDQFFTRVAGLLERGAGKYGDRNWEKANSNEELDRFKASAMRHLAQWITGEQDEDHAAAVVFNLMAYETIKRKVLSAPSVQVPDIIEKRVVKILDTDPEGQSMWYRTDTDGLFRCPDYPGSAALTETEIEREYGIQERFYE